MPRQASHSKDLLRLYFNDIVATKPLSRAEEVALAARIQQGDVQARDDLVRANLAFVVDVARKYQYRGLSLTELISAGNEGLLTAAERFDGTRGYKFISYAVWWIRQSILKSLAEHVRTVRLPVSRLKVIDDIAQASQRLAQLGEAEPDLEDIARELEIPLENAADALGSSPASQSLDQTVDGDDDGRTLLGIMPDSRQQAPDAAVLDEQERAQIDGLLAQLDQREYFIVRSYYGLDGEEPLTLEQIGALMRLTRERVRQLKNQALVKLRDPERYELWLDLTSGTRAS